MQMSLCNQKHISLNILAYTHDRSAVDWQVAKAVDSTTLPTDINIRNSSNISFVNDVAVKNVELNIQNILNSSEVISEMVNNGEVKIIGAMYDVSSGAVNFFWITKYYKI